MKIAAALLVVLALTVAVVPMFTDCQSQGRAITLANGSTVAMKCHWSGVAELALAAPLLFVGLSMFVSKRKETRRVLALLGLVIGAVTVAVPTMLIGVCASADMLCNSVMRPTLVLAGILIMVISAASWAMAERATEGEG
jgi:hypothetical protein